MNIFVTGSTGTIGREVVRELSAREVPFRVGVTSATKKRDGLESVIIDYGDAETLTQAFGGADTLFLLTPDAPQVKVWVENAVDAAEQVGVRHIVRSSGIGADVDSPYEVMRQLGELERIVEQSGIPWTFLRPNSFMQNFATFDREAIRSGSLYVPRGNAGISFVDVRDVARVAATILCNPETHARRVYTLTGSHALTLGEAAGMIGQRVGKDVTYTDIGEDAWAEQMRAYGMPEWNIHLLLSLYQADKDGVTAPTTRDIEQVTGQAPHTFEAFVNDYASAWEAR